MTSVVIPVFNKFSLTSQCLTSVLAHSNQVSQVIVVDNASSDETPAGLKSFESKFASRNIHLTVIRNEQNQGFGRACNQGIRVASGEFIAILNNDTWVMPEWDDALRKVLLAKQLDVVGPFFDERPNSSDHHAAYETYLKRTTNQFRKHFVPILMYFDRSAIERLKLPQGGIFDERFFVTYEDTDLLHRMRKLKMRYGQTSLCYIWHQSMGTRSECGAIPTGYEAEGLRLFMEKWGFDPRSSDHRFWERLKRRYRTSRAKRGLF